MEAVMYKCCVVLCDCDLRDIKTEVMSTMQQLKTVCLMKFGVY